MRGAPSALPAISIKARAEKRQTARCTRCASRHIRGRGWAAQ
ncbi:hypothetical protein SSCG_04583 [Streptomyces clavuligerus]|nr:hypothetical protein SSCG_04583 [Streptomyces clavuligerus]